MPSSDPQNFYVVGIGTSAGGLEALEKFFTNVPPDSEMAFVVIQHLSPDYKSHMVQLLSKFTSLSIHQVEDGMAVEPNAMYLIPRRKNMTIHKGKLFLIDSNRTRGLNLPIDIFFDSLATDLGDRAVGIILSGTGSDGTRGIRAIKEAGGLVLAQDDSARFDGMPRSAISTQLVDFILPAEEMPASLLNYIQHPCLAVDPARKPLIPTDSTLMERLFMLLKSQNGVDFSDYKPNTIIRRIERRMSVNQIESLENYVDYLEISPQERRVLFKEFLIGVTRFFRDPEFFQRLENDIVPALCHAKQRYEQIRVWISGCSTGEEAYSLAILFREYIEKTGRYSDVKIFATDIDSDALEFASQGVYAESIVGDVSEERLRNFFIKRGGAYEVLRQIRSMVVFANQNLVKDPPFSKMDLISCRNLLIYLQPKLQEQALSTFQFALNPGGHLCLGTSETVGDFADVFIPLDNKTKIFRYEGGGRPRLDPGQLTGRFATTNPRGVVAYRQKPPPRTEDWRSSDPVLRSLVEQVMPPCVVVDENFSIIHMFGDLNAYIGLPRGYRIEFNLLKMVREPLALPLTTALHRATQEHEDVIYKGIKLPLGDDAVVGEVNLSVQLFFEKNQRQRLLLVMFTPAASPAATDEPGETFNLDQSAAQRISVLEQELQYTRENLQATIEELETANEELQATNEELMAANEELQSTNEELQSVNEEMVTVNNEYQAKIQELTNLNDDVNNLFKSIEVGTIFLDASLRLRKFTPVAQIDVNLLEQDIGRPISHLTHNLKEVDLLDLAQKVMDRIKPQEIEVQSFSGNWYQLKVMPFRNFADQIEGVIITLVNINQLKRAELQLTNLGLARKYLDAMGGLVVALNQRGQVAFINHRGCQLLGYSQQELNGQNWFEICLPPAAQAPTLAAFADLLDGNTEELTNFEHPVITRGGEERLIAWENTVLRDDDDNIVGMLGSGTDITEQQRAEAALRASERKFRSIIEQSSDGIGLTDETGRIIEFNPAAEKIFGLPRTEALGQPVWATLARVSPAEQPSPDVKELLVTEWQRFYQTGEHPSLHQLTEFEIEHPDGVCRTVQSVRYPIKTKQGFMLAAAMRDVTDQRQAENQLQAAQQRLAAAVEVSGVSVFETSVPPGPDTYHSKRWAEILGYARKELPNWDKFYPWLEELIHPDDRPLHRQTLDDFIAGRRSTYFVEIRLRHKLGHYITVQRMSTAVERDEHGQVTRMVGVMRDVTVLHQQVNALQNSENRYRTLVDNLPNGAAFLFDRDLRFMVAGGEELQRVGRSSRDYEGKSLPQVVSADAAATLEPAYRRTLAGQKHALEYRNHAGDDYLLRFYPVEDDRGQVTAGLLLSQNINTLKRAEREAQEQRDRLADILNVTGLTAFQQDVNLRYTWIQNPALGFTPEDMVGQTDEALLPATDVSELVALKRRVLEHGQDARQQITLHHNGQAVAFELALAPLRNKQDQVTGLSGIILDQH